MEAQQAEETTAYSRYPLSFRGTGSEFFRTLKGRLIFFTDLALYH